MRDDRSSAPALISRDEAKSETELDLMVETTSSNRAIASLKWSRSWLYSGGMSCVTRKVRSPLARAAMPAPMAVIASSRSAALACSILRASASAAMRAFSDAST